MNKTTQKTLTEVSWLGLLPLFSVLRLCLTVSLSLGVLGLHGCKKQTSDSCAYQQVSHHHHLRHTLGPQQVLLSIPSFIMISFDFFTFPCMPFYSISCHHIPFHCIPFYSISCHHVPLHAILFHFLSSHSIPFHLAAFHYIPCLSFPLHSMPSHFMS